MKRELTPDDERFIGSLYLSLGFAGLFVSGTLALGHFLNFAVPCGTSGGCATVAAHPASRLAGVPLAYLGFVAYAVIVSLALSPWRQRPLGRALALLLTTVGAGGSLWLVNFSLKIIHTTCTWCLASAGIFVALFLSNLIKLFFGEPSLKPQPRLVGGLIAASLFGIGAMGVSMYRAGTRPPLTEDVLKSLDQQETLNSENAIGPKDAPIAIVEFSDLYCPVCQGIHEPIKTFQRNNPKTVRWVFRNRPLMKPGHELAGVAAKLSEIAAEKGKFWEFLEAVFADKSKPTKQDLIAKLVALGFDAATVEKRLADNQDPAQARALADLTLAEKLKISSTPTFIVFVRGYKPISAQANTIAGILNGPTVAKVLQQAQ